MGQSQIYDHYFVLGDSSHHTKMSGCTLRFTKSSPVRATLIDEATGHVKYKIETPIKVSHVVTRIRKFESHTQPSPHTGEDTGSDSEDDMTLCGGVGGKVASDEVEEGEVDLELPESSDEMGRIYWKLLAPDKIGFQGKEHIRSEFLPKCGKMSGYVDFAEFHAENVSEPISYARSYTFIGPDGVEYRWAMGALGLHLPKVGLFSNSPMFWTLKNSTKLVTADEGKTIIAEFHRPNYFIHKQKARLDVRPEGMQMLDLIVLTFVYVERKRRQREGTQNRQPG